MSQALRVLVLCDRLGQGRNYFGKWQKYRQSLNLEYSLSSPVQTLHEISIDSRFNDNLLSSVNYLPFVKFDGQSFLQLYKQTQTEQSFSNNELWTNLQTAQFYTLNNPLFVDLQVLCEQFNFLIVLCNEEGIEHRWFSPLLVSLLSSQNCPPFALFNVKVSPQLLACVTYNFEQLKTLKSLSEPQTQFSYFQLERFGYDLAKIQDFVAKNPTLETSLQDFNPNERLTSRSCIYNLNYYALNIFNKAQLVVSSQSELKQYLQLTGFTGSFLLCPVSLALNPAKSCSSFIKSHEFRSKKEPLKIVLSVDYEQIPQSVVPFTYFEQLAFVLNKVRRKYPNAHICLLLTKSIYICLDQVKDLSLKLTTEQDFFNAPTNQAFKAILQSKLEPSLKLEKLCQIVAQSKSNLTLEQRLSLEEFCSLYEQVFNHKQPLLSDLVDEVYCDHALSLDHSLDCDVLISNSIVDLNSFKSKGVATQKFNLASSAYFNSFLHVKNMFKLLSEMLKTESIEWSLSDALKTLLQNPIAKIHIDCLVGQIEHSVDIAQDFGLKLLEQRLKATENNGLEYYYWFDENEESCFRPEQRKEYERLSKLHKEKEQNSFNLNLVQLLEKGNELFSTLEKLLVQAQNKRITANFSLKESIQFSEVNLNLQATKPLTTERKSEELFTAQLSNYTQSNRYEMIWEQLNYYVQNQLCKVPVNNQSFTVESLEDVANLSRALSTYNQDYQGLKFLSYGCSSGIEVFELLSIFDQIEITGVDISQDAISFAQESLAQMGKLQGKVEFTSDGFMEITYFGHKGKVRFMTVDELIKSSEQFNVIVCMTVLCHHPEDNLWLNSLEHYPIEEFINSIKLLDLKLANKGLLCLYNANYLLEDTPYKEKYHALYPSANLMVPVETNTQQLQDYALSMEQVLANKQKLKSNEEAIELKHDQEQIIEEILEPFALEKISYPLAITNYLGPIMAFSLYSMNLGFGYTPVFNRKGERIIPTSRSCIYVKDPQI